jgi:hypothetical protein
MGLKNYVAFKRPLTQEDLWALYNLVRRGILYIFAVIICNCKNRRKLEAQIQQVKNAFTFFNCCQTPQATQLNLKH